MGFRHVDIRLLDGRIAAIYTRSFDHLAFIAPDGGVETADVPYTAY
jgi:hypothetical protein